MKRTIDPFKQRIIEEETKKLEEQEMALKKASLVPPPSSGIDLKDLLSKTKTILWREVQGLMQESTGSLLSKDSSQALINYIKVLQQLIKEENDLFDNLTEEQLESLLKSKK